VALDPPELALGAHEARHAPSPPHVPVTQRVTRPVTERADTIGWVVAHARRNRSSACVRQAQLIGTARRPPSTTTMHTSPITLSIHEAGSGTDVVLRMRLPEVTS
jgi:hypothetical protein